MAGDHQTWTRIRGSRSAPLAPAPYRSRFRLIYLYTHLSSCVHVCFNIYLSFYLTTVSAAGLSVAFSDQTITGWWRLAAGQSWQTLIGKSAANCAVYANGGASYWRVRAVRVAARPTMAGVRPTVSAKSLNLLNSRQFINFCFILFLFFLMVIYCCAQYVLV